MTSKMGTKTVYRIVARSELGESPDRAPFGPFFTEKRHIRVRAATLVT